MKLAGTFSRLVAVACFLGVLPAGRPLRADTQKKVDKTEKPEKPEKPEKTVYDYSLVGLDTKEVSLAAFKGKVLLVVNLASQSIFKNQIFQLEDLQKSYKDKGLVILGVPCNDFGAQEPGTDADIQKLYANDLHVSFPVFAKASVRGKDQAALFRFLTADRKTPTGGDVHWSYTKFLIDRAGKVVARFEPDVTPSSPELQSTIEEVLAGRFKPQPPKSGGEEKKEPAEREDRSRS